MAFAFLAGCGAAVPGLQAQSGADLAARRAGVTLDLVTYNTYGLPAPFCRTLAQ